jgi:arylsulfatase
MKQLISFLRERGQYEQTYVIITSDHGEVFGERSYFNPGYSENVHRRYLKAGHGEAGGIHDTGVYVPLIVKPPEDGYEPQRVRQAASLTEFPSSVRTAIEGGRPGETFVPDDHVVVSVPQEIRPGRNVDKPTLRRPCFAVYETTDDGVEVTIQWGEELATGVVYDAQQACIRRVDGKVAIDPKWDDFEDAGVWEGSEDAASADVRQRQEDLGYVD